MSGERSVGGDVRGNVRGEISGYHPGMAQVKPGHHLATIVAHSARLDCLCLCMFIWIRFQKDL